VTGSELATYSVILNFIFIYIIWYLTKKVSMLQSALNDIKNIATRFGKKDKLPKTQIPPRNSGHSPSNPKIW